MRLYKLALTTCLAGAVIFYWITAPELIEQDALPEHTVNLTNGEQMFWVGGCGSCHAADGASGNHKLLLSGGLTLDTPFGAFVAPNISPHDDGIGQWSDLDFVNAMIKGVSPEGKHYYPAFPYTNYQRMPVTDVLDLKAFLDTLPPVAGKADDHSLGFPFNIRWGLGLWKWRYLDGQSFEPDPTLEDAINRGRYLVDGPGHCGACHTPRDRFGGELLSSYLQGASVLEVNEHTGEQSSGWVPNITSDDNGLAEWTQEDIAYSLETGFTPEFDSFGGSMSSVQDNIYHLSASDRMAIAAYLKSLQ